MKNLHENFVNNKFESVEDEQLSETIGGEWLIKYPLSSIVNLLVQCSIPQQVINQLAI